MIEIFEIKNENTKHYYVSDSLLSGDETLSLRELTLDGIASVETFSFKKDDVSLVSNPSAPWKAAYLVWRNSVIIEEIDNKEKEVFKKQRHKMLELLAFKYQVDFGTLLKIIEELDEVEL